MHHWLQFEIPSISCIDEGIEKQPITE